MSTSLESSWIDTLVRVKIHIYKQQLSSFKVCGLTGLSLASLTALLLVWHLKLSFFVMIGIIVVAVATFLILAMATKMVIGEERLVYYHHEIAITTVAAIVLWLFDQPVLRYLDITILCIGTFLTFGRIGCLMVGCCHGRPYHFGVCYSEEHAHAGFTPYYVGVRLFPIQAVESLWALVTVFVGILIIINNNSPGSALAWYIIIYDVGRFFFEFFRGDPERPYFGGFSEAQWTSLLLMCVVVWGELAGVLPIHLWHFCAIIGVTAAIIFLAVKRHLQKTEKYGIYHPQHVGEVAEAIKTISVPTHFRRDPPLSITSLGIRISAGNIMDTDGGVYHYTISCQNGALAEHTVRSLAGLILKLKHVSTSYELIKGRWGVYHLLISA